MTKRVVGKDNNTGAFQLAVRQEELELLEQMFSSSAWKIYKEILQSVRDGHLFESMSIREPYALKEKVSIAAGINLAVNQLGVLVQTKQKLNAKSVEGETKNPR